MRLSPMLTAIASQIKEEIKRQSPAVLRLVGVRLLSKPETEAVLQPHQIQCTRKPAVDLVEVNDAGDPSKVIFPFKRVETEPDYIWEFQNLNDQAELMRSGNMRIGSQFLNTDFGNQAVITDLLKFSRRKAQDCSLLIAPWCHDWAGYFDYTLFVAAKLCRIKQFMSPADFERALLSYPLLRTTFETEMLGLLGIRPEQLLDSRQYAVHFDRCVLANNSSWFYPSATDALALKAFIEQQLPPPASWLRRRLYISRVGRRRVLNEEALIQMLLRYNFEIIEDKPRSVAEQVRLYLSASFIIGPHGASFANILWCRPDTQLFEFFTPKYGPEYFRYLTHILGLRYAAYCLGPMIGNDHGHVQDDILVSVDEVERALVNLLKDERNRPDVPASKA